MSLNLISVFMRWLRQILRIGLRKESPGEGLLEREQVEITLSPVERSIETLEPGEPEELSREIGVLFGNPQKLESLGKKCSEAASRYSWESIAESTERIYFQLTGRVT